jgi:mannose-6-phosphate isomerase-like protein (cupin superfamily)
VIVHNKEQCPRRERSGLVSRILLQQGDLPGLGLTATWVDVAPRSRQRLHHHPSEQVYVVTAGRGAMMVENERREVAVGDLVYVPPNVIHGIENSSKEVLTYVSAATPAIDVEAAYDTGQLRA